MQICVLLVSGGGMSAVMVKTWQRTFWFFWHVHILGHQKLGLYLPISILESEDVRTRFIYLRKNCFPKNQTRFSIQLALPADLVVVGSCMIAVQGIEKYIHGR